MGKALIKRLINNQNGQVINLKKSVKNPWKLIIYTWNGGKIYERVGGYVFKLSHTGGSGGPGIRIKRRPSANLIHRGDRGGQYASGIRK